MLPSLKAKLLENKNVLLLLVSIGIFIYFNSWGNKMFWDDEDNILKNAYVQDWQYIGRYFTENVVAGRGLISNYWRPVVLLFWSIEWKFFGEFPFGYHFVHTTLHIINACLLFYFLLKLTQKRFLSLFVSIVFLVHPLQTEAITYVSGTSDPLSAFLILLGLIIWQGQRFGQIGKLGIVGFIYLLLLMVRETAIVFPAYLVLIDYYRFFIEHPKGNLWAFIKRNFSIWAIVGVIGIVYLVLRATILNLDNTFNLYGQTNEFTSHFEYRLFTFLRVLSEYFELLIVPHDLHMERTVEIVRTIGDVRVIGGIIIMFISLFSGVYFLRRIPLITFGILWFWIGIFPTSNVAVPVNGLMYEHWLYLPLIGFSLTIGLLGEQLFHARRIQIVGTILLCIWILFLGIKTIIRNSEWRDPITFYNQTLQYAPDSYRIINNLAMAYADEGQQPKAIEMYTRAITLDPQNAVAYHNLGNSYKELKERDKAIESFNKAISLNPQFFFSYNALISLYLQEGDYQQAEAVALRLLDVTEDTYSVYNLLSQITYQGKDYKKTEFYMKKLQEMDPPNLQIKQSINQLEQLQSQK